MTVVLRLSKGPEMVAVPDVRGKTQKEAEAKIRSAVLSVYSVTSEPPPAAPSGDVRSPDGHQGDWSWRELWNLTLGFAGLCLIPIALFAAEQKWSYYSSTIAGEMLIFVSGFLSFKSKKSCAVIAAIFVIVEFLLVSFALFSARVIFKEMSFGWLIVVLGLPIIFLSGILAHYLLERDDSELFIASFPLAAMGAVGFFFFKPDIYNYRLGHAYYSNGDYDRAIAAYNKGIMFSPDRKVGDNYTVYNNRVANSYNGRGDAYYSKGDYDSAIADYSQAIDINPDNAIIYSNRANAYASKGGFDSAIADLTEAIKLNPNNNGFKERLAGLKQLVKVPIVANMAEARKKIPAAGLTLIVNYVYHNSMPKGNVIDSSPAFGSFVPRGTKVTLRVSSGPALISVPNVAGMTEEGAKAAINSAGLEVDVTHENNNSMKNGCVIDSSPAFGSFVPPGTKVTLRVSSGPALISVPPPPDAASEPNAAGMKDARATIPYVAGMTKERAEAEIKSKGLNAVVKYDGNHKVKKGNVIDSSPKNGTLVKPGATVILLVSSRRRIITRTPVPYVDGMTEERAEAEIKSKGFLKVDVLYENNNSVKNRYVIGTIPAYGNSLKPEETVTLRVSSGPYIGEKSK
jgi:beta-lactam-binding protein with PASTA domain